MGPLFQSVTLEAERSTYYQISFSRDSNWLGARNSLGVLHLWRVPAWEEIAKAEAKKKPQR